eukprot:GHRQ01003007.1.p1 GENE.GHRQ01003007.1~~GHRQ01003007.1.p1  ORF type:complete len:157 (-),score=16.20 GHRQ01003007.1:52-522(-)
MCGPLTSATNSSHSQLHARHSQLQGTLGITAIQITLNNAVHTHNPILTPLVYGTTHIRNQVYKPILDKLTLTLPQRPCSGNENVLLLIHWLRLRLLLGHSDGQHTISNLGTYALTLCILRQLPPPLKRAQRTLLLLQGGIGKWRLALTADGQHTLL